MFSLAGDDQSREGGMEGERLGEDSHCHRPVHPHPSSQIMEAIRFFFKCGSDFVIWLLADEDALPCKLTTSSDF